MIVVPSDGTKLIAVQRIDLDLSKHARARELSIADNRTSEVDLAWSPEAILALEENPLEGFDEEVDLGQFFTGPELDEVLDRDPDPIEAPEPKLDQAAALQKKWKTARGQIWEMGRHRLMCGDCTDAAILGNLFAGNKAALIVTDPPYGVDYEGGRNPESNVPRSKIDGDSDASLYAKFLLAANPFRHSRAAVYLWFAGRNGLEVYKAVESSGLTVRALLIWNKIDAHYGNFMAQYMQKHEPCLYCVGASVNWYGPTNEVTVWDIKQPTANKNHATEKPIECMARPIKNSTKLGDIVFDGFLGSGTTMVACEQLGRVCYGVEIEPKYVAVTLERLSEMGLTPKLVHP